jgi:D-threo-aldose 1-dehydrogenase
MQRAWQRTLPGGKSISALGFGCSSMWAKPQFSESVALEMLAALVAEGVNHFDTSPSYGNGLGERRLGTFLANHNSDEMVVSTKVGTNLTGGVLHRGFTRELMERSFLASLDRLGLKKVDILYLHGPSQDDLNATAYRFFDDMKAQGRIAFSGVNSFDNQVLEACVKSPIDSIMLQYNVGDFRNREAMERLHDAGKIIFAGTTLSRASFDLTRFLPIDRARIWYLLRMLRHNPAFAVQGRHLKKRLKSTGLDPFDAAIRFVTGHPCITSSLFGTSSLDHAIANARAGHKSLTTQQWTSLASYA